MMIIFKKRLLLIVGAVLAALGLAAGTTALASVFVPPPDVVVVLDAGHGGIDAGVIGVNSRVKEAEINLIVTRKVEKLLKRQGITVILTRNDAGGLYGDSVENFKRRDLAKRKAIILEAEPTLVLSIHCNKFPDRSRRGGQVFYNEFSEKGKALAKILQSAFNPLNLETAGKEYSALAGDYYMLNCSPYPSAIIECAFLSNPEDDALMNTPAYQDKVAGAIYKGVMAYLLNVE
jgi:N-acetylmuramoyl-L-alanine amidase